MALSLKPAVDVLASADYSGKTWFILYRREPKEKMLSSNLITLVSPEMIDRLDIRSAPFVTVVSEGIVVRSGVVNTLEQLALAVEPTGKA